MISGPPYKEANGHRAMLMQKGNRPVQKIIKIYVFVFSLLLIGCSQTQLIYLKDAELARSVEAPEYAFLKNRPEGVKLLLNGHYVKSGNNLVLLIRKFDAGKLFTIDDETYEKLTIEIKSFKIGVPVILGSDDISFYYSSGSSGFIHKGHGVYSTGGSGSVTIKEIEENRVVADMDIWVLAKSAGVFSFERSIQIRGTFVFNEKRISDLTPWLGVPDPSFGREVYPHAQKKH